MTKWTRIDFDAPVIPSNTDDITSHGLEDSVMPDELTILSLPETDQDYGVAYWYSEPVIFEVTLGVTLVYPAPLGFIYREPSTGFQWEVTEEEV